MTIEQGHSVVLVVDDNSTNLGVLFKCLHEGGFKVLVAEDGESAIDQAAYAQPDIILLDVLMPGLDGFETCKRLKQMPSTRDIPVIFMTALTDASDKVKSFQVGAVDYVSKPFQHEEVLVRVRNHVRIRSLQRRLEAQNALLEDENRQRRQAEAELHRHIQELRASNAELDAFARTVAHDLKDPLARIVGFAEMLEDDATVSGPAAESLRVIASTGRQMADTVNALLLLAYVRHAEVVMERLDMAAVVTACLGRLEPMIAEHGATIRAARDWPEAVGYRPWIEQVWMNYLSNAIKYGGRTPEPPVIELGAAQRDGRVRFWVRDQGRGLSADDQARLFLEFSRLERDRARGHGLGLSIVRRIIDKLGGEVGVDSKVGRGSEFYFTLPAAT